jgi:prepilin-type processing-associated H-X9-DG protein
MQPKDYRNVRFSEIIAFTAGRGHLIPVTKNGPRLEPSTHGVGFRWFGTGRHNGGYGLNAAYFDGHVRYIKDFRDDFDRVIGHLNWSYWD